MRKVFLIILITFCIISCDGFCDSTEKEISDNPDLSLKGSWFGSTHGGYLSSISEFKWYNFYAYEFYEDNRFTYYSSRSEYGVEIKVYYFIYVWKIENNQPYCKLYDNKYSDWEEFNLEKIDNNTIMIDGIKLERK